MKCSNCPTPALYKTNTPGVSVFYYCRTCLPKHLHARADAGQLDIPTPTTAALDKKKSPKAEEVESSDEDNEG